MIGDTQHYRDSDGRLCALEPVVAQLDRWAALFDEVVLCAPLDPGPPPVGFGPYASANLRMVPLPRGGGNSLWAKLSMLRLLPTWFIATRRVARSVDAVHIRCPCNIGLVALFSTWRAVAHRYAMYAGVWRGYPGEPRFFGLQRRLLGSAWFDGPVSVYSGRQADRPNLEPFFSPSYSSADCDAAAAGVEAKLERLGASEPVGPWRLVTVGRLTPNKNQKTTIEALALLVDRRVDAVLDVLGDGPCRAELEALASELGVAERVRFRGSVSHLDVMAAFATADIQLLATRQEGFGKVLLEGMVHGVVPIFSESPVADEISGDGARGLVVDLGDASAMAAHVEALVGDRTRWKRMAGAARDYAAEMTLDRFSERVREMLERNWDVSLPDRSVPK